MAKLSDGQKGASTIAARRLGLRLDTPGLQARRHSFPFFVMLLMVGCGSGDTSKEGTNQVDPTTAADAELLSDSSKAIPELIRRVRASVKMRDSLIMVEAPLTPSLSVLPATSPWLVNCGIGITAVFGNSVSGGSDSVDDDVKVWLAYVPVSKQDCETYATTVGKEIQTIISGR
jgi:hypothetical protein